MAPKNQVVSVRLTEEQYEFFTNWQKKLEEELGIDVPLGAVIRRSLDGVMRQTDRRGSERGEMGHKRGSMGGRGPGRGRSGHHPRDEKAHHLSHSVEMDDETISKRKAEKLNRVRENIADYEQEEKTDTKPE